MKIGGGSFQSSLCRFDDILSHFFRHDCYNLRATILLRASIRFSVITIFMSLLLPFRLVLDAIFIETTVVTLSKSLQTCTNLFLSLFFFFFYYYSRMKVDTRKRSLRCLPALFTFAGTCKLFDCPCKVAHEQSIRKRCGMAHV